MSDLADDLADVLKRLRDLVTEVEGLERKAKADAGGSGQAVAGGSGAAGQQQGPDWPGEVKLDLSEHEVVVHGAMLRAGLDVMFPVPGLTEPGLEVWRPPVVSAQRPESAALFVSDLHDVARLPDRLRELHAVSPAETIFVVAEGSDFDVESAVRRTLGSELPGLPAGIRFRGLGE